MLTALFIYTFTITSMGTNISTSIINYPTEQDCIDARDTMTQQLDQLNESTIDGYAIKCQ